MDHILLINGLSHSYRASGFEQQVLSSVHLEIASSQLVLLKGPSGCGKSTLLTLISGMRSIQEGSIRVFGQELYNATSSQRNHIRAGMGLIFQSHRLLSFLSAEENIMLAMDARVHGISNKKLKMQRARNLLEQFSLYDQRSSYPGKLSGGQRQRVAIARALACGSKFIIADEPTASLDYDNAKLVMDILRGLVNSQAISILMTTHDDRLHAYADRILRFDNGRLVQI